MEATPNHAIDVAAWRAFPLARVETNVNVEYLRRLLLAHRDDLDPSDDATLTEEARQEARKRPLPMGKLPKTPKTGRKPDAFYQAVADAYTFHAEHRHPPAQRISQDWKVPVSSVHGWISEARAAVCSNPLAHAGGQADGQDDEAGLRPRRCTASLRALAAAGLVVRG